jgi:multidrug efflux pump subunit AcrB
METTNNVSTHVVDKLVRTAILCAMTGMIFVLIFLIFGFHAWSVGLGVFLGMPLMLLGVLLYIIAVFRDLKFRRVLDDED